MKMPCAELWLFPETFEPAAIRPSLRISALAAESSESMTRMPVTFAKISPVSVFWML